MYYLLFYFSLSCGLVCTSGMSFQEVNYNGFSNNNNYSEHSEIMELISKMHLPQQIIDPVLKRTLRYEKNDVVKKSFPKKELIVYSLYKILKEMQLPRSLKEIETCSGIPSSILWKIESHLCEKSTSLKPVDLISSHYILFDLDYGDFKVLKKMCEDVGFLNYNPATTASFIVHIYLKKKGNTTSIKNICSVFGSNYRSINQLRWYLRRNKPNFKIENYVNIITNYDSTNCTNI